MEVPTTTLIVDPMGGGSLTFGGRGGAKTSWRKSKFGEDVCCTQGHHISDLRLSRPKKRFFGHPTGQRGRGGERDGEGLAEAQLPHVFQDGVSPFAPELANHVGPCPARLRPPALTRSAPGCQSSVQGQTQRRHLEKTCSS